MKFISCSILLVLFGQCVIRTQGYGKTQGTGFFPSMLPTYQQFPMYQSRVQAQQFVYPPPMPVVKPVPAYHHTVVPYATKIHTPHVLYPALPAYPKRSIFSSFFKPSVYGPYHNHQDTVAKSVVYSVLLSEILRRV
ncbi:hypothetical protein ACF0H5_017041 [Mactra antiquata]